MDSIQWMNYRHVCLQRFRCVEDLIIHIKDKHSGDCQDTDINHVKAQNQIVLDTACKCNMVSCGVNSRQFSNLKELVKHMNTVHLKDARACIFKNCSTSFRPNTSSRYHFDRHHLNKGEHDLKYEHLLEGVSFRCNNLSQMTSLDDPQIPESSLLMENVTTENIVDENEYCHDYSFDSMTDDNSSMNEEYFLDYFADFYNRMAHIKYVPYSTIQEIAEEYLAITTKSQEAMEWKLRSSLETLGKLSEIEIKNIVDGVKANDYFLQAQYQLNTQYKRNKYVDFVEPIEIMLNESEVKKGVKKDVFHYIPIVDSLKVLVQDKSFKKMMAKEQTNVIEKVGDQISDISDGLSLKTNSYFRSHPDAYGLHFYSDAVEIGKLHI